MTLLQFLLKIRHSSKDSISTHSKDGFTMIELLIGAIMAFLIITPLLGFVVSILNDDSREQVKTAADYELQSAIDYISEDLSQAYYIYDPDDPVDGNQIEAIRSNLPSTGTPILVFWKLHRLKNSAPLTGSNIVPRDCTPALCNDTSVRALVSYHLVEETNQNSIWCQPTGNSCPKRIVRHLAHEPLERFRGTGVLYNEGDLSDSQKGTLDIPLNFSLDENPTANFPTVPADEQVLVNYISRFSDTPGVDEIDVSDTNDSVQFTITANARRRIDGSKKATEFCDQNGEGEGTAFCPKANVRVEGLRIQLF